MAGDPGNERQVVNRLKVIYISSKRAVERRPLEIAPGIEFREFTLHLSSSLGRYLSSLPRLFREFLRYRPQVVLFEAAGLAALPAVIMCRLLRVAYALRVKGDPWQEYREPVPSQGMRYRLTRCLNFRAFSMAASGAAGFLPISPAMEQSLRREIGPGKPSCVVPIPYNRVVYEASCAPAAEPRQARPLVLTVTNFNFWGKLTPLLQAIPSVYPMLSDLGAEWLIAGGGTFLDECRHAVPAYEHVFLGNVGKQDLFEMYRTTTILLYVSGMDGLPNVLLEGSLFGIPIIINHDSPASGFVRDMVTGRVVDITNITTLRTVFSELLQDADLRQSLGHSARATVIRDFSPAAIGEQLQYRLRGILIDGDR